MLCWPRAVGCDRVIAPAHAETVGVRLAADLDAFRNLPAVPLEPCEKRTARVSSTALVRYRGNDYSVPTSHGFQEVMVKGFVDQVVILCGGAEIARHRRSYGSGTFVFDPLHYLALIETKPNALDQAAPLKDWNLPETFQHLRHLLVARMDNRGKREFIQRRQNVIALGNSGTGKTHVALAMGSCRLPEGIPRRLHHRGCPGAPPHGGPRRKTPAEAAARTADGEAADRR